MIARAVSTALRCLEKLLDFCFVEKILATLVRIRCASPALKSDLLFTFRRLVAFFGPFKNPRRI